MKKNNSGFTLIEITVAMGLFMIVMFIATGSLLSIVSLNKKAQAQQSAINNINYALENMARSIRTGSSYHCQSSSNSIDTDPFDCAGNNMIIYQSDGSDSTPGNTYLTRAFRQGLGANAGIIEKYKDDGVTQTWTQITDPSIVIQNLTFVVSGSIPSSGGNLQQPLVRIHISGYAFVGDTVGGSPRRVDFNLQTLASQRKLDI